MTQLSRREREVAELVSQGLTNREIAGKLHVSVRTVEYHIQQSLNKLGLRSRTELAAWFLATGKSPGSQRTNLPVQLTTFVGREREMSSLLDLDRQTRLLTLTGSGGCGKTRLGMQLAGALLSRYPDGVWFVELGPLADGRLIPHRVSSVLGIEGEPERPMLDTLADRCRERRVLFLLDNCEHLVAASADTVDRLLRACPHVSVIATSREPLRISGEVISVVSPLTVPPAPGSWLSTATEAFEAVKLFVERASAVRTGFQLSDDNAAVVAGICRRLDGIPLAIELAAAQLYVMALDELQARLDHRLDLLVGGTRDAPRRQQTLRAALDWSHDCLDQAEMMIFRRLAVFAGGFSLQAAEAVCSDASIQSAGVLQALKGLVTKSLIVLDSDRYGCLETIHEYAAEQLGAASETRAVSARHTAYYFGLASARRPGQLKAWLHEMDSEVDNLRSALRWATSNDPHTAVRLAWAIWMFWMHRGHHAEARDVFERLAAAEISDPMLRVRALVGAAILADLCGARSACDAYLEQVAELSNSVGQPEALMIALRARGMAFLFRGNLSEARSNFENALDIAIAHGDLEMQAMVLHNLGEAIGGAGNFAGAKEVLEQSLAIQRRIGREDEAPSTLAYLAGIAAAASQTETARRLMRESLMVARDTRSHDIFLQLEVSACLAVIEGQNLRAIRVAGAGSSFRKTAGVATTDVWLGLVEPYVKRARALVDPSAAAAAWDEGSIMTVDQAVDYVLSEWDAP
ncbi:MAG TPA: LuxR C-terminal-related transcriptional regulator [Candidatus Dormibacteraeota bacterium]|nr:LuxR C-terminal-related transcriptional regulator [Candidatus Dormibacteraeota bacterium]